MLKDSEPAHTDLLDTQPSSTSEVSVVLLQDGVRQKLSSSELRVYALSDDVRDRKVSVSYPLVSYADMLRMILESDTVIAL